MTPADKSLPKLSFAIVTYNEERRIARCLQGIASLRYPKDRIEIVVMDGGSSDKTRAIAEQYGAPVHHNAERLPEPGLALAYRLVKGDYMVYMAADNIIHDPDWATKMVQPFLDHPREVLVAFCRADNDPSDNVWNRYVNEDVEPFSAMVFGRASHPDKYGTLYATEWETDGYVVYRFTVKDYPLITLAQCAVMKTGLARREDSRFDDILPLIHLIEEGKRIAFVRNTGIYHYSFSGFRNYCRKFRNRIRNSIQTRSFASRAVYNSPARRFRQYLFIPYSLSLVFPLLHGIAMAAKRRKWCMLIHPIASLVIGWLIVENYVKIKVLRSVR